MSSWGWADSPAQTDDNHIQIGGVRFNLPTLDMPNVWSGSSSKENNVCPTFHVLLDRSGWSRRLWTMSATPHEPCLGITMLFQVKSWIHGKTGGTRQRPDPGSVPWHFLLPSFQGAWLYRCRRGTHEKLAVIGFFHKGNEFWANASNISFLPFWQQCRQQSKSEGERQNIFAKC